MGSKLKLLEVEGSRGGSERQMEKGAPGTRGETTAMVRRTGQGRGYCLLELTVLPTLDGALL